MKSLLVIRHAKSSWAEPELPDVIRPLNDRGQKASKLMGKQLALKHEKPDLMISSPATRAYHTAINIARPIGYRVKNIEVHPAIYYEGEQGVMNLLRYLNDKHETVCLFGHEPTCSSFIHTLTGEYLDKFPTGAIFKMQLDINTWNEVYEAKGSKIYFITPKELAV